MNVCRRRSPAQTLAVKSGVTSFAPTCGETVQAVRMPGRFCRNQMWTELEKGWQPVVEILILAVLIYFVFNFVRGTRGWPRRHRVRSWCCWRWPLVTRFWI